MLVQIPDRQFERKPEAGKNDLVEPHVFFGQLDADTTPLRETALVKTAEMENAEFARFCCRKVVHFSLMSRILSLPSSAANDITDPR